MERLLKLYNEGSTAVKSGIWFGVAGLFQKLLNYLTLPYITSYLSLEEYGEISLYNSWSAVFVIILTFNISGSIYNISRTNNQNKYTVFYGLFSAQLLILVVCFLFGMFFIDELSSIISMRSEYLILMTFSILANIPVSIKFAEYRFDYIYKRGSLLLLFNGGFSIVTSLVLMNALLNPLTGYFLGPILSSITTIFIMIMIDKWLSIEIPDSLRLARFAISFGAITIFHYMGAVVLNHADRMMIDHYMSKAGVAVYSLGYSVGGTLLIAQTLISQTYGPWFFRNCNSENASKVFTHIRLIILSMLVVVLILDPFWHLLIESLFGSEYQKSVEIIKLVAFSNLFILAYSLFANFQFFFRRKFLISLFTILAAVLNIILNYLFLSDGSIVVAAYTTLASYMVLFIGHYILANMTVRKELNIRPRTDYSLMFILLLASCIYVLDISWVYSMTIKIFIVITAVYKVLKDWKILKHE